MVARETQITLGGPQLRAWIEDGVKRGGRDYFIAH